MNKEVLIFIPEEYADWEGAYISSEVMQSRAGYVIKTLAVDAEPKTSMGGFKTIPDYTVDNYPTDFCMLILLGGLTWDRQQAVLPVVQYAINQGIFVGAICNAANFLAEHGFLDQIRHTGNTLEYMKSRAPHYRGDALFQELQAVSDGGIVTANGYAVLDFTRELMLLLKLKPEQEMEFWCQAHKYGFYPSKINQRCTSTALPK